MNYMLFKNDLTTWAIALTITCCICLLLYAIRQLAVRRLHRHAQTTTTYIDDAAVKVLSATHVLFMLMVALFAGSQWVDLSDPVTLRLTRLALAALLLQVARWGDVGIREWLEHYRQQRIAEDIASTTSTAVVGFLLRLALWVVILLMILDNFGVNITTLVASLGIGGIAVALALQNILGDLLSSLSIVLDKPFVVGDFIIIDEIAGTVEHIGLKTTRIRSLSGEQIVFSNSDMLKSRIRNYKRMETRRIVFPIQVVYQTSQENVRAIPQLLREAVEAQPLAQFDRAHFKACGPSALEFETVYIVQSSEYRAYMDIQQNINMQLFERFAELGIKFAHPTQTLQLTRAAA
jgi:small-conductance mechanosensitive channel